MTKIVEFIGGSRYSLQNYINRTPDVWSVNTVGLALSNCSIHWNMDDVGTIMTGRRIVVRLLEHNDNALIMTSRVYPGFDKKCIEYPLQEVLDYFAKEPNLWFNHTPSYMFPHAIMKGFTEIHLHGFDYLGDVVRNGQYHNVLYWIDLCKKYGVEAKFNPASKLVRNLYYKKFPQEAMNIKLDKWKPGGDFYGYYPQPTVRRHVS